MNFTTSAKIEAKVVTEETAVLYNDLNLHQKLDHKMASDVRGIHFLKKNNLAIELHISDILPPEY